MKGRCNALDRNGGSRQRRGATNRRTVRRSNPYSPRYFVIFAGPERPFNRLTTCESASPFTWMASNAHMNNIPYSYSCSAMSTRTSESCPSRTNGWMQLATKSVTMKGARCISLYMYSHSSWACTVCKHSTSWPRGVRRIGSDN